jgi:hypothetical protein
MDPFGGRFCSKSRERRLQEKESRTTDQTRPPSLAALLGDREMVFEGVNVGVSHQMRRSSWGPSRAPGRLQMWRKTEACVVAGRRWRLLSASLFTVWGLSRAQRVFTARDAWPAASRAQKLPGTRRPYSGGFPLLASAFQFLQVCTVTIPKTVSCLNPSPILM